MWFRKPSSKGLCCMYISSITQNISPQLANEVMKYVPAVQSLLTRLTTQNDAQFIHLCYLLTHAPNPPSGSAEKHKSHSPSAAQQTPRANSVSARNASRNAQVRESCSSRRACLSPSHCPTARAAVASMGHRRMWLVRTAARLLGTRTTTVP
jgi:hypothetical protein